MDQYALQILQMQQSIYMCTIMYVRSNIQAKKNGQKPVTQVYIQTYVPLSQQYANPLCTLAV